MRALTGGGIATLFVGAVSACASHSEFESSEALEEEETVQLDALESTNQSGSMRTFTDNNKLHFNKNKITSIAFFTSFGTNGRTCLHCHAPGDAFGLSPQSVAFRFTHPLDPTNPDCVMNLANCPLDPDPTHDGSDPIFRLNDGANSPNADVSTADARRAAYSMLLGKGLIRVELPVPTKAEFVVTKVDDPYEYATTSTLSLYRRPLPSTNLRLSPTKANPNPTTVINTVMWDGRETLPAHDVLSDLLDQANGATLGHAQATAGLSDADRLAIVDFETGLHTAQNVDNNAGVLFSAKGNGGPDWLAANQPVYLGINDVLAGDSQTGAPFDPNVFTIYDAWASANDSAKMQIARGQALFNTKPITIRGVSGLNDRLGLQSINGTCTVCHDSPNYGNHSVKLPVNIGLVDIARRTPNLPLYTLYNPKTAQTAQVTDPGRAMITGLWADIGKFKGPILRGLAARAPYFHNGSATTLLDAVNFYDTRFQIGFTDQEKADLVAFLATL